jgi:hypothetical protein
MLAHFGLTAAYELSGDTMPSEVVPWLAVLLAAVASPYHFAAPLALSCAVFYLVRKAWPNNTLVRTHEP